MADARLNEFSRRMDGALEALRKEFAGLRTGRASAHLLDTIVVRSLLVQIAVVAVSMLLAIETTRLWIFLIPLVAIPAGCEVARRPPGERWAALLAQLVLVGVTCQTMVFLRPT